MTKTQALQLTMVAIVAALVILPVEKLEYTGEHRMKTYRETYTVFWRLSRHDRIRWTILGIELAVILALGGLVSTIPSEESKGRQ